LFVIPVQSRRSQLPVEPIHLALLGKVGMRGGELIPTISEGVKKEPSDMTIQGNCCGAGK
jgi:hypothetical protein